MSSPDARRTLLVAAALACTIVAGPAAADNPTAKEAKSAAAKTLATCTEDDFLASGFEFTQTADNTSYTEDYAGCYTIATTNDDDLELSVYTLGGNLTAGGPTFYASDNGGSLDEPIWYFADAEEGATAEDVVFSFLCFDLDANPADDTHPSEVTNWGVIPDESTSSTTTTCDIAITCGCSDDDDDEAEADDDDSASNVDDSASAAWCLGAGGRLNAIASFLFALGLAAVPLHL